MAGCGSCGGNKTSAVDKYRWTSDDGNQTVGNLTIVQAKSKVDRKGGSYVKQ